MADRYPEILSDLAARATEMLEREGGLPRSQAERIARLLADQVGRDWAGQQIYIGQGVAVSERDKEIYRLFNGCNHSQLAQRYRLTERQVYNIVAKVGAAEFRRNQIPLFPED